MRYRQLIHQRRADQDAKMTPMIDVVFLLLIYFLWTASFQMAEYDLPGQLSARLGGEAIEIDPTPQEADFHEVIVRIAAEGPSLAWTINGTAVPSLADLRSHLNGIGSVNPAATVILHPDDVVPLGDVIDVYDAARLAGFDSVSFAATPSGETEAG